MSRSSGRLLLALIPYALGLGAAVWLGVWIQAHDFLRDVDKEERRALYVASASSASAPTPTPAPVAIAIKSGDCMRITRAEVDADELLMYARNDCHWTPRYLEWRWQQVAANGTLIDQGYTNSCPEPEPKQEAECSIDVGFALDARTASVALSMKSEKPL